MPKKGLLVAVAILAGLGGLLFWSNAEEAKKVTEPAAGRGPRVIDLAEDDVTGVRIRRNDGSEAAVVRSGESWSVTEPKQVPASSEGMKGLVRALALLQAESLVDENNTDPLPYGLASPSLEVTMQLRNGKQRKLVFGGNVAVGNGVYLQEAGSRKLFIVAAETKAGFDKGWQDLRDRVVLPIDVKTVKTATVQAGGQKYNLVNKGVEQWDVVTAEGTYRGESAEIEETLRKLRDLQFEVVEEELVSKLPALFAAAKPVERWELQTAAGNQWVEVREDAAGVRLVASSRWPQPQQEAARLAAEAGKLFGRGVATYQRKKLFSFENEELQQIRVTRGGNEVLLNRPKMDWERGGKTVSGAQTEELVEKMREWRGSTFVAKPKGEVYGTWSIQWMPPDAKKMAQETVTLLRDGDRYVALRPAQNGYSEEASVVELAQVDELYRLAERIEPGKAAPAAEKSK